MSVKKNLVWDILEPELDAAEERALAPAPLNEGGGTPPLGGSILPGGASPETGQANNSKAPPAGIPTFFPEQVATVGNQLLDLRGFGNFRRHILVPQGKSYRELRWPDVLLIPWAKPGVLLNSVTFEVQPQTDFSPRSFRFASRTEYGVQIFVETKE